MIVAPFRRIVVITLLVSCSRESEQRREDALGVDSSTESRRGMSEVDGSEQQGTQFPIVDGSQQRDAKPPDADDAESDFAVTPDCVHPKVKASCENGLCTIPAGCFVLGVPRDSKAAAAVSDREVQVTLTHSFLMGETEVTRGQWLDMNLPEPRIDWDVALRSGDPNVPLEGYGSCLDPQCPVVWITYEDAMAYANLRSESEGLRPCYLLADCVRSPGDWMRCGSVHVDSASPYACEGYRLPTEAEWEYAARAGTRTDYYSGNMGPDSTRDSGCPWDENLDRIAWYCGNTDPIGVEGGKPHQVGQKKPNGFGLYDMLGNVFEWANDRYSPLGYGRGPLVDPVFGVDDPSELTPATPVFAGGDGLGFDGFPGHRIRRGGSFDLWPILATSGRRGYQSLGVQHAGFRIVRTLKTERAGDAP